MNENDQRYVDDGYRLIGQWIEECKTNPDGYVRPVDYLEAIRDLAELCRAILSGERVSPWHDSVPENYLAVLEAMKGPIELGPIEMVDPEEIGK